MSKSKRATMYEATEKIREIRDLHALGRAALKLPPTLTIEEQAVQLNRSAPKVGVARRFAAPGKGYTQDQLEDLCALILKHRALVGTSHVESLITIPWPERDEFQTKCVKKNWSRRELIAEKTKHFRPKSKGGRPP